MRTATFIGHALFASGALAGCYSGGATYGMDQGRVAQMVSSLCLNGGIAPITYPAHYTETKCYNIGAAKSITFRVENRRGSEAILSTADCVNNLIKEVAACEHGGESVYSDWKIKADPNDEPCH